MTSESERPEKRLEKHRKAANRTAEASAETAIGLKSDLLLLGLAWSGISAFHLVPCPLTF